MFPIEADLRERILEEIVPAYLRDNVKARLLQADGTYVRASRADGEPEFRAQERLLALRPGPTTAASDIRSAPVGANGAATDSIAAENAPDTFAINGDAALNGNGADGNGGQA